MNPSKMESKFGCQGARRYIVRAAEGGEEVVQSVFVGQIDNRELRAPLVSFAVEQVIVAQGEIEQTARLDALRIVIVIFRPRGRNVDER